MEASIALLFAAILIKTSSRPDYRLSTDNRR